MALGSSRATSRLRKRIGAIQKIHGYRTVLLGGPPCQSYSLIGRARNAGNASYSIEDDPRHLLYKEYVDTLATLRPAVAVMENVKGFLSACFEDKPVFDVVMKALQNAGGYRNYQIFTLSASTQSRVWGDGIVPSDFLVRAEEHGVPQRRHRVFLVCIRSDLASKLPTELFPTLNVQENKVSVEDVIGDLPRLRSRLSRGDDTNRWQQSVGNAIELIQSSLPSMSQSDKDKFLSKLKLAEGSTKGNPLPHRGSDLTIVKTNQISCPEVLL